MPDGGGDAPAPDQRLQAFPVRGLEQLAVPHVGQQLLAVQVHDGDPDAHRSGQGAAAHLVDAGEEPGAGAPEAAFVVEGGCFGHGGGTCRPLLPDRRGHVPEDVRVVVQGGDAVQRPGDDGGLAFDVGEVDEAAVGVQVGAGVGGVVAVVAHDPDLAFGNHDVEVADLRALRRR